MFLAKFYWSFSGMTKILAGTIIPVCNYKERQLSAIVLDPDGLGKGKPTVGLWFNAIEDHIGIPKQTLSDWAVSSENLIRKQKSRWLKAPSGKTFALSGNIFFT